VLNIAVLCTLSSGLLSIQHALSQGLKIEKVIGLRPNNSRYNDSISGYVDIKNFCHEYNLKYEYVDQYTLKDEDPSRLFGEIDLLWVTGWQRLIPENFINYAKYGAIGAHGSCDGIMLGRGRSPQNWALLMGSKNFEVSIFRISKGIDDGSIVASDAFALSSYDNILSSNLKVAYSTAKIVFRIFNNPILLNQSLPQTGRAEYFPKRIPEDGGIDWNMSVIDIHNQVKSLADPYPNARTFYQNIEMRIKKSLPILCEVDAQPGYIEYMYPNGDVLVKGRDGFLLIEEYKLSTSHNKLAKGLHFNSINMQENINKILFRFRNEFPNKQLNSSLKTFWLKSGFKIDKVRY
jgi:methionyl-tRNA formyltransferase